MLINDKEKSFFENAIIKMLTKVKTEFETSKYNNDSELKKKMILLTMKNLVINLLEEAVQGNTNDKDLIQKKAELKKLSFCIINREMEKMDKPAN